MVHNSRRLKPAAAYVFIALLGRQCILIISTLKFQ